MESEVDIERIYSQKSSNYIASRAISLQEENRRTEENTRMLQTVRDRLGEQDQINESSLHRVIEGVDVEQKFIDQAISDYEKAKKQALKDVRERTEQNQEIGETFNSMRRGATHCTKYFLTGATSFLTLPSQPRNIIEGFAECKKITDKIEERGMKEAYELGVIAPAVVGVIASIIGTGAMMIEFGYEGALTIAATNAASGIYELTRHKLEKRKLRQRESGLEQL